LTLAAFSYSVIEAIKIADVFNKNGVDIEVIDMRSTSPLDYQTVLDSVHKTGHFLVIDTSWVTCGIGSELLAKVSEDAFFDLKKPPKRIGLPDIHAPTSPTLSKEFYPTPKEIGLIILKMLSLTISDKWKKNLEELKPAEPLDVPFIDFNGPF
jgi:pyruvate dehydrogenase E1 component beta subunit